MPIRYMDEARADFVRIVEYRVAQSLPDPVGIVRALREKIAHLDRIQHPGCAGRVPHTREWVLGGLPYIAVFQRDGETVKVYRVFHGARQWPQADANCV